MGIKATADLKPTFSTSSGLLYVTVESSQPVVDDLTVKVTANADIYSFGGTVTKKQYIVTVKIEADHTTGKGSVSLSGLGVMQRSRWHPTPQNLSAHRITDWSNINCSRK